jgi:CelD/BcsL family acetyltransferase involved in cellulose biosynthesis
MSVELEQQWRATSWAGEQAEYDYFMAALGEAEPFAVFAPGAAAVGRLRSRRLDTSIGYLRLYAPRVRVLELVAGGVVARDRAAADALANDVWSQLAGGLAEVLTVPALPVDSPAFAAFAALGGPLERQRFIPTWTRRRLVLPESFDAFLSGLSRKSRAGVRYDSKKLVDALGDELSVSIHRDAANFDELVGELDRVASGTYQRALGAGFADTPEQRRLTRLALEHDWLRAYVLAHRGRAIAFWLCSVHGPTITLKTTGFDPAYAHYRVGIYLLMRVIEDAIGDPVLEVLDFGPGRSDYKRHFSNDGYEERNLVLFAPSFRPRMINVVRTGLLGAGAGARRVLDATGGTARVKSAWRSRLRGAR